MQTFHSDELRLLFMNGLGVGAHGLAAGALRNRALLGISFMPNRGICHLILGYRRNQTR